MYAMSRDGPGAAIGLGVMRTVNLVPPSIQSVYGSRAPVGGLAFIGVHPTRAPAGTMHDMQHVTTLGVSTYSPLRKS
jgi:hypothetical protein